jgi:hypothetical protein
VLAISNPFTVTACTTATVAVSPGTVVAGGSVTVSWSGICAPNNDGLRLYAVGGSTQIKFEITNDTATGSRSYSIPASLAPGSYEIRLHAQNTSSVLAVSSPFTVTQ